MHFLTMYEADHRIVILNGGPGASKLNDETKKLPASLRKPGDAKDKPQQVSEP